MKIIEREQLHVDRTAAPLVVVLRVCDEALEGDLAHVFYSVEAREVFEPTVVGGAEFFVGTLTKLHDVFDGRAVQRSGNV